VSETDEREWEALEALHAEQQRARGVTKPEPPPWAPSDPRALAVWRLLPANGRGVEYDRLCHAVTGVSPHEVRMTVLGLVLIGKAYCAPSHQHGASVVGRGDDPRVGAATYRTGALGGLGS
jgi:hypothetical protein